MLTLLNDTPSMLMHHILIMHSLLWSKGHLAKFCFDRINASSNHIWVKKGANPHGPKKVWVLKFTPIVFDVGVGSLMT